MRFFKYFITSLLWLLLLTVASCKESSDAPKTLLMGTSADYPPFEFIENDQIVGMEIDIAKAIAAELGYELKVKDMDFAGLIPALNSNHFNFVIAALSPTPERLNLLDFSEIYYQGQVAFVTLSGSTISKYSDLNNKVVGVQLGSVWEKLVTELATKETNITLKALSRVPQLVEELKGNMVDVLILEKDQAIVLAAKNSDFIYHLAEQRGYGYAIAFKKGSPLTSQFNQAIAKLRSNGTISEIVQKWINQRVD